MLYNNGISMKLLQVIVLKIKKDIFKNMRFYLNEESSAKLSQQLQLFLRQCLGLTINHKKSQIMKALHKKQKNNFQM